MTAPVVKAIFRHRRWDTDRVVHFTLIEGAGLYSSAERALALDLIPPQKPADYELRDLYYLGTLED